MGISSGASTPEVIIEELVSRLKDLGATTFEEFSLREESTKFPFPHSFEFSTG